MDVGNIVLSAISDGTFVARPGYFGDDATAEGHGDLFDRRGQAWLPIGCFLVRTGDRCVLVEQPGHIRPDQVDRFADELFDGGGHCHNARCPTA